MQYNPIYLFCITVTLLIGGGQAVAQNPYLYEKGKSFKGVPAHEMPRSIDLTKTSKPICTERQLPEGEHTLSYRVVLPAYTGGIFFSRDSRPGDFEWPNNTNRLLPWVFDRMEDITHKDYPGIPSNASPSTVGDALLLRLADGGFLFAKAVAGDNSLSWMQVNPDGTLSLYLSTLGEDNLTGEPPLLLVRQADEIHEVLRKAYRSLMADKHVSAIRPREGKARFEAFDYLGWCTWEHYHYDIDEAKILKDINTIENSEIPIRYVLIDDGHIANSNRQVTSLTPDKTRFPNGWSGIMQRKRTDGIRWMGLWYSLSGYWMGISPGNDFPAGIQQCLYPHQGALLPGKDTKAIDTFYEYYVGTLKQYGFDFLKIDNQSFTLPLYMGGTQVVRQAKACNLALERQTHRQGVALLNCMAHNVLNTDHTMHSAFTRVSIDYKKYDEDMAKSHLFQSYTNTLTLGQTVWPDHDMFHSSDTVCGSLMARSKAVSGGPVYLSDSPADFVAENILPLIDEQGRLFRPSAPAVPTPESVITNPLHSGKAYRVSAPVGNGAVALIAYNLNVSPRHHRVTAHICPQDYTLWERKAPVLLYDWNNSTAERLTAEKAFSMEGFSDHLFHLCPIRKGWAVIGIEEKYLSPATVDIVKCNVHTLVLDVHCPGTLLVWVEHEGRQELRRIPVDKAGEIRIHKSSV